MKKADEQRTVVDNNCIVLVGGRFRAHFFKKIAFELALLIIYNKKFREINMVSMILIHNYFFLS